MKYTWILIFCFVITACTSTENIQKLNQSLKIEHRKLSKIKKSLELNAPVYQARFEIIEDKVGNTRNSSFEQLKSIYSELAETTVSFSQRTEQLFSETNKQRLAWGNRQEVSSKDSDWANLTEFKRYAKDEYKYLMEMHARTSVLKEEFKQQLSSKSLKPYSKNLPRSFRDADIALRKLAKKRAYKSYNRELIVSLNDAAQKTALDFDALVAFADFDELDKKIKRKFSRQLDRRARPSNETYQTAKEVISTKLNKHILTAARDYAKSVDTVKQASYKLRPINQKHLSHLLNYINENNLALIEHTFTERKDYILNTFVTQQKASTIDAIKSKESAFDILKFLVKVEQSFVKKYSYISNEVEFKLYLKSLQNMRIKYLELIEENFVNYIQSRNSLNALSNPLDGLLSPNDRNLPVVNRINKARIDKFKSLTAFKPALKESEINISSFTSAGLNYESELLAIYLGDFNNARLATNSLAFSELFHSYLEAYGHYCSNFLPSNKVMMTKQVCSQERVTTNGWGYETDRTCVSWIDQPTGIYADPNLYSESKRASKRADIKATGKMLGSIFTDPFSMRSIGDEVVSVGDDMKRLVRNNKCNNMGLKRFEHNLYRFSSQLKPLRLPGKETLASFKLASTLPISAQNINFSKLINDLIIDNSKTWAINRYRRNSVSNVSVSKDTNDQPTSVRASYRYSTLDQVSRGGVRVSFKKGLPNCLYFSDAPNTCRQASRGVINRYENGHYAR